MQGRSEWTVGEVMLGVRVEAVRGEQRREWWEEMLRLDAKGMD